MKSKFLEHVFGKPSEQGNTYEETIAVAKRAKQITALRHENFLSELAKMGIVDKVQDQPTNTGKRQALLAKVYEEMETPVETAAKELKEQNLYYNFVTANGDF